MLFNLIKFINIFLLNDTTYLDIMLKLGNKT